MRTRIILAAFALLCFTSTPALAGQPVHNPYDTYKIDPTSGLEVHSDSAGHLVATLTVHFVQGYGLGFCGVYYEVGGKHPWRTVVSRRHEVDLENAEGVPEEPGIQPGQSVTCTVHLTLTKSKVIRRMRTAPIRFHGFADAFGIDYGFATWEWIQHYWDPS